MSLVVHLHDLQKTSIGPADIPAARAFPVLVRLKGSGRLFLRRGPNVGKDDDVFDEIKPVVAVPTEHAASSGPVATLTVDALAKTLAGITDPGIREFAVIVRVGEDYEYADVTGVDATTEDNAFLTTTKEWSK